MIDDLIDDLREALGRGDLAQCLAILTLIQHEIDLMRVGDR